MKKCKEVFVSMVLLVMCVPQVWTVPLLKLPVPGGETWWCAQGNYNDPKAPNDTHRDGGSMKYAWDFNWGFGEDDNGKSVVAPSGGTVVYAMWGDVWKSDLQKYVKDGWGNTVIIDYGDGSFGKICHLDSISVSKGAYVVQGQEVGKCGGTGGWPSHIHYQTQNNGDVNGQSIASSFVDVDRNSGIPLEGKKYLSRNFRDTSHHTVGLYANGWHKSPDYGSYLFLFQPYSEPFLFAYLNNGGKDKLGTMLDRVHQQNGYWVQDSYFSATVYTLVLNPYVYSVAFNYLGVCYPIHGRLRDYWITNNPGAPVTNEYYWPKGTQDYVVQWFEHPDDSYIGVAYNTQTGTFRNAIEIGATWQDHYEADEQTNTDYPDDGRGGGSPEPAPIPTPQPPNTAWRFGDATICTGVQDWEPVNRNTETFYHTADYAYAWLRLDNIHQKMEVKFRWFWDDGYKTVTSSNIFTSDQPPADGWGWLKISASLQIKRSYPETRHGRWDLSIWVREYDGRSGDELTDSDWRDVYTSKMYVVWDPSVSANTTTPTITPTSTSTSTPTPTATFTRMPTVPPTTAPAGQQVFSCDFEQSNPFLEDDAWQADDGFPKGSVTVFEVRDGVGRNGTKGLVADNAGARIMYRVQVETLQALYVGGYTYDVSFWARADNPGTAAFQVMRHEADRGVWVGFGVYQEFKVTTDWTKVSIRFTATGHPELVPWLNRTTIHRGQIVGNLYLDDFDIRTAGVIAPTPTATPTPTRVAVQPQPTSTPTVTPTVTPTSTPTVTSMPTVTPIPVENNKIDAVFSADFENGNCGFVIANQPWTAPATLTFISGTGRNGGIALTLYNGIVRPEKHNLQAKRVGGMVLMHGRTYEITFYARASQNSFFNVQMIRDVANWTSFGLSKYDLAVGDEWRSYQFQFTAINHPELSGDIIRLTFHWSLAVGNFYVDDILIREVF